DSIPVYSVLPGSGASVGGQHGQRRVIGPYVEVVERRAAVLGVAPGPDQYAHTAGGQLAADLRVEQPGPPRQRAVRLARAQSQLTGEQGFGQLLALCQAHREAVPLVTGYRFGRVVVVVVL